MTTHKNKKLSSFSLDQNNLGPLLPDPQKGAVFTSVTTGSPFRTRNSNLYQAQNEQNDCVYTLPALRHLEFTVIWHHALPTNELSLVPCASTVRAQTYTHVKPTSELHFALFWEEKSCGQKPFSFCSVRLVVSCA